MFPDRHVPVPQAGAGRAGALPPDLPLHLHLGHQRGGGQHRGGPAREKVYRVSDIKYIFTRCVISIHTIFRARVRWGTAEDRPLVVATYWDVQVTPQKIFAQKEQSNGQGRVIVT